MYKVFLASLPVTSIRERVERIRPEAGTTPEAIERIQRITRWLATDDMLLHDIIWLLLFIWEHPMEPEDKNLSLAIYKAAFPASAQNVASSFAKFKETSSESPLVQISLDLLNKAPESGFLEFLQKEVTLDALWSLGKEFTRQIPRRSYQKDFSATGTESYKASLLAGEDLQKLVKLTRELVAQENVTGKFERVPFAALSTIPPEDTRGRIRGLIRRLTESGTDLQASARLTQIANRTRTESTDALEDCWFMRLLYVHRAEGDLEYLRAALPEVIYFPIAQISEAISEMWARHLLGIYDNAITEAQPLDRRFKNGEFSKENTLLDFVTSPVGASALRTMGKYFLALENPDQVLFGEELWKNYRLFAEHLLFLADLSDTLREEQP